MARHTGRRAEGLRDPARGCARPGQSDRGDHAHLAGKPNGRDSHAGPAARRTAYPPRIRPRQPGSDARGAAGTGVCSGRVSGRHRAALRAHLGPRARLRARVSDGRANRDADRRPDSGHTAGSGCGRVGRRPVRRVSAGARRCVSRSRPDLCRRQRLAVIACRGRDRLLTGSAGRGAAVPAGDAGAHGADHDSAQVGTIDPGRFPADGRKRSGGRDRRRLPFPCDGTRSTRQSRPPHVSLPVRTARRTARRRPTPLRCRPGYCGKRRSARR